MRKLSVPARWAAVTALTIAASTGCMSVGDDGAKPGPAGSTDSKGRVVEPDGGVVSGTGGAGHRGGDAHTHSDSDTAGAADADPKNPKGTPSPKASGAVPSATPKSGAPRPEPGVPQPSRPGRPPAPTPSAPGPGEPPPVVPEPPAPPPAPDPDPAPEPEPTEPAEPPPSASPAAQLRTQSMGGAEESRPLRTPEASPQVRPV
ncbi:hypothetical protein [Streptomyces sp. NPDC089173]|uniref:hypothetical protein n=1 Tax=unclassified Streptomyces TaxID=2593676 RepID=UPI00344BC822